MCFKVSGKNNRLTKKEAVQMKVCICQNGKRKRFSAREYCPNVTNFGEFLRITV